MNTIIIDGRKYNNTIDGKAPEVSDVKILSIIDILGGKGEEHDIMIGLKLRVDYKNSVSVIKKVFYRVQDLHRYEDFNCDLVEMIINLWKSHKWIKRRLNQDNFTMDLYRIFVHPSEDDLLPKCIKLMVKYEGDGHYKFVNPDNKDDSIDLGYINSNDTLQYAVEKIMDEDDDNDPNRYNGWYTERYEV